MQRGQHHGAQERKDRGGRGRTGSPQKIEVRHWRGPGWVVVCGSGKGRVVTKTPCEADAIELAEKLRTDLDAGVLDEPDGPPEKVADVLDRYLNMKKHKGKVRQSTLTTYGYMVSALKDGMGSLSFRLLDRRMVQRYVRERLCDGRSPETVKDEIRTLRMAIGFAAKRGWWHGDQANLFVDLNLPETLEKAWLQAEEVRPFLDAVLDERTLIACKLALFCGLRAGEVVTRQWRDLDLRRGLLHVGPKSLLQWTWTTKNGKSRWVPLPKDLRADLKAWWLRCGQPKPEAWIVPCQDGSRRRDVRTLNRQVQRACEKAGITTVTFHGLRHSFVSLAIEGGVDVLTVSRIAGHHSAAFTMERYAHIAEARFVDAANQMERHVSAATLKPANKPATKPATEEMKSA